jgi:chorismate dehydratase
VVLTKILFREFLGFEPEWINAAPDIDAMLASADAALLIGDPALLIADRGMPTTPRSKIQDPKTFDLAELWHKHTGLGFVFAMWMTRKETSPVDFAAARDEGFAHIEHIATNYQSEIPIGRENLIKYLSENISYSIDDSMRQGMELYFELAKKTGLLSERKPLVYVA